MGNICVFCGSQGGSDPRYRQAAVELGKLLAERGHGLVYGGGHIGLMGAIADTVMQAGGTVDGVIPKPLTERELALETVTRLHVVSSMHERKA
ncbi:MAG: LOG family protein, partial [Candidatus Tectomicrobia bacterium]|nr:LOG family protein [Candidatus Tectomicrobia bacterium]